MRTPSARAEGTLIVLVGPKGSGKSTIGRMLAQALHGEFLDVEQIAQRVLTELGGKVDEQYARRAFAAIEEQIDKACAEHPLVVFETTGASESTPAFLDSLRARHRVKLVRVQASWPVCQQRMATRDASRQVAVPPELIRLMHDKTLALQLDWDATIDNEQYVSAAELVRVVSPLLPS